MATATFNPSLSGFISYEPGTITWAGMKAATDGTSFDYTTATASALYLRQNGGSPNYDIGLRRVFFLFDTSSLPDNAVISAATLDFYHNSHGNTIGGTPGVVLVSSNPASTSALANADYDQVGSTAYSDTVALTAMTNGSLVRLTLNASGIAAITPTGISKFAMIFGADQTNTEPTWTANFNEWYVNMDLRAGSANPVLTVTYTVPGAYRMFQVF